jgi:hypothetical protein
MEDLNGMLDLKEKEGKQEQSIEETINVDRILEQSKNEWKYDIHIIKQWMQFFGWLTIVSIAISIIAAFVMLSGH